MFHLMIKILKNGFNNDSNSNFLIKYKDNFLIDILN